MVAIQRLSLLVLLIFCLAALGSAPAVSGKLTDAVKARDIALVRNLLATGEDVHEKVQREYPINVAAAYGPAEIVAVLLDAGANIEQSGRDGLHPLHNAVLSGRRDIVMLLLQKGAMVNTGDKRGLTPLVTFATSGGSDIEIPKVLLAAGADPNIEAGKELDNNSALQYAAQTGNFELAEMLIAAHADLNHGGLDGETALHLAAESNHPEIARLLIANGADVNLKSTTGWTPLYFAADDAMKQLLIDAGANP